jgi:hypothetical protein
MKSVLLSYKNSDDYTDIRFDFKVNVFDDQGKRREGPPKQIGGSNSDQTHRDIVLKISNLPHLDSDDTRKSRHS